MKEEFDLKKRKYKPRALRNVMCIVCGGLFKTNTNAKCCGKVCSGMRRRELMKKRNKKYGKKYFADKTNKYQKHNKEKIREKAKRQYSKNKEKNKIRAMTRHSNEKTGICSDCGRKGRTEFHHLSFEPNIFVELCKECHNDRHGRNYYGR